MKGKGGVLSHIRDNPECIVLFDEIEKADPNVGELLFRIIDDGQCEDKEGNPLDFRRSFIIFTTNAGAVYEEEKSIGFGGDGSPSSLRAENRPVSYGGSLRSHGSGRTFPESHDPLLRLQGAGRRGRQKILQVMLEGFAADPVGRNGYEFVWDQDVVDHLVKDWEPALGARSVAGVLRTSVKEHWVLANLGASWRGSRRFDWRSCRRMGQGMRERWKDRRSSRERTIHSKSAWFDPPGPEKGSP